MTRKKLIGAVVKAARRSGYAFHTGFEYRMNSEIRDLPALWLIPPKVTAVEGTGEGVKKYEVNLRLLAKCDDPAPGTKEKKWGKMEDTASRICMMLAADENVKSVSKVEFSPAEFSLTNRGELSLAVSMEIGMPFCNIKKSQV